MYGIMIPLLLGPAWKDAVEEACESGIGTIALEAFRFPLFYEILLPTFHVKLRHLSLPNTNFYVIYMTLALCTKDSHQFLTL